MNARKLAICLSLATVSLGASAGPVLFDSRTDFENQGTIAEFQDFESFNADEFTLIEGPFVDGSVTYTSAGDNLIVGANTFVNPINNTMSYDQFDTALTADIGGAFNMHQQACAPVDDIQQCLGIDTGYQIRVETGWCAAIFLLLRTSR